MTDQQHDIDIEAERTAFIIARKGVHYCDCMLEGWLARARLAATRERELEKQIADRHLEQSLKKRERHQRALQLYAKHVLELEHERDTLLEQLQAADRLLRQIHADADAGRLDFVDLEWMVAADDYVLKYSTQQGEHDGHD